MPTYSYACTVCDHAFDIRQSFTDDNLTDCPECDETSLRKVIHPVGISFKGSGFYKTDSRASSKPTSATTPSSAGKGEGTSDSSSSSSTTAAGSTSSTSSAASSTSTGSSSSSSGSSSSSSTSSTAAAKSA